MRLSLQIIRIERICYAADRNEPAKRRQTVTIRIKPEVLEKYKTLEDGLRQFPPCAPSLCRAR